MNLLESARVRIDEIDAQMAALFEERMKAVGDVIIYKRDNNMPILDAGREALVVEKNTARIQNEELKSYYADYIRYQMSLSRAYQAQVLGRDQVAYQGVEGAFSHIAAMRLFPHGRAVSFATWEDVFDAVESGRVARGVLPFENSNAGDVSDVLDLCYLRNLYVVDVYDLPVSQNLLALPGAKLSDIRDVYSHPQAISQSKPFLQANSLPTHAMTNTALAAKYVADSGDVSKAAIASPETAALYGLQVLVPNINSDQDNTTRFIVVSKEKPTDGNRFSLLFTVDNKPGKLAEVIQCVGASGFNMESIKSRPMPHERFQYYFYIEVVGSPNAESTRTLLTQLDKICRTVRLLGIYRK